MGQEGSGSYHPVFYVKVEQPTMIADLSSDSIPSAFSENPFGVYVLMNPSGYLEWVLCSSHDNGTWDELKEERGWGSIQGDGTRLFFSGDSKLENGDGIINVLLANFRSTADINITAGLMAGWNAGLKHLYDDSGARAHLVSQLIPELGDHADLYDAYSESLIQELTSVDDLMLEADPNRDGRALEIQLTFAPGTRLNRIVSRESRSDLSVAEFVPGDAKQFVVGAVDGIFAANYLNFHYKASGNVEHEAFQKIRDGFDQLDGGVIDRWDGSWAKWTPEGLNEEVLLLGGDFQSSDLTELFDMLGAVDLGAANMAFRLDEDNTVVGFTRIRSLDIFESESDDAGTTDPKRYYFAVGQGKLAIAESEDYLIELVFQLNRRVGVRNSAKSMINQEDGAVVNRFEAGMRVGSVRFSGGSIQYRRTGSTELAHAMLVELINKLR